MLSLINQENADAIVTKLLKRLNINIDTSIIIAELDKHPDYPSLLAISDVLTNFNIANAAFRIEPENLINIPYPFIIHTNVNDGDFVLVDKIDSESTLVSSEKWNRHKMSLDELKKIFTGIVLTAESNGTISNSFLNNLTVFKIPVIITVVLLLLLSAVTFNTQYFSNLSWQTLFLTLFKSTGLVTSVLLLIQSIDSNNPLVQKLCNSGSKTNCNAILSSKAAKVFDGLTWSEVGFFYFSGTWLLLLFGGSSTFIFQILTLLNFVSLPYTIYSIYYQAKIAKQWCVLCCTVQALLWLEFIPLITNLTKSPFSFEAGESEVLSAVFICLLLPVILWTILKPIFLKLQQLKPLKQQIRKFKYNNELFNIMLTKQPKYAAPDEEWSIVLGNTKANNVITMVSNPYCSPCAETHKHLQQLLEHRDDVQARVVFYANNDDKDVRTQISRHLMALNEFNDKKIVANAMHDWYEQKQKNYEAWATIYPVELKENQFYKIDKQNEWCEMAGVAATPTLLLNGYLLPNFYMLPDLKYMF